MSLRSSKSWSLGHLLGVLATLGLMSAGCADVDPPGSGSTTTDPGGGFISDSPFGGSKNGGGEDSGGGAGGGETTTSSATGGDGAEKAIIEADIIQVHGDQLFALSQYGGLSVVDMANPAHLTLLGNYKVQGVPFEMYMQDEVVYAMFSSFGRWECTANYESCDYIVSSHIEALDVSDPAHIAKIGSFDLPGEISDSRIVGDVLYAVSYENGYCWNCSDKPTTTVTSIKVGDPADIAFVDSVSFDDPNSYSWGWRRSISVTQDRMYIAGIEWDGNSDGHSTIQIVDITDPAGLLHVGASVEAKGQIESRWQMDEKDGVLRVISQPGIWWTEGVPQVQTFQVANSDSITPIATLDLQLPMPERLRSARFDGDRLFAITAEQQDPLFTIDVSDPAQPLQLGEVELPGWIYYLEPRGDRLFALGFDNANPEGSMNVTLFNVADLANPSLIQRVNFGGDWSWAPEDQDRIHKAFKVDTTLGTVFVPYGAYDWDTSGDYYYCGRVESGVQMVDFTQDSLTKRGSAPLHGFARRALMHEDNLFTVSDSEVQAFDIADRDAPAQLDAISLSAWANQSLRVGNNVVRVSSDWWSNAARLDIVPANDPGRVEPLGSLDLVEAVDDDANDCYGWGYFWGAQMFKLDNQRLALTWSSYPYYYDGAGGENTEKTHVVVINVANPAAPTVEGRIAMSFSTDQWGYWSSLDGGKSVVQIGNNLVFRRVDNTYSQDGTYSEHAFLEVADLSDPGAPLHSASIPLPDGNGHSLLVKNGSQVLTSHWEPVPNMPGKVRFYLDRVAFAGSLPLPLVSLNVPGALVSFDDATMHALTMDFHEVVIPAQNWDDCYQTPYASWYGDSYDNGYCAYMQQTLKLIGIDGEDVSILDAKSMPQGFYAYGTQVTDTRVFAQGYRWDANGNSGTYVIFAIGDIGGDEIQLVTRDLPMNEYLYSVASQGDHLILASYQTPGIHDLDATDLDNMTLEKKADVMSYVYSVTLDGSRALCSMGPYGLEAVDLQ